MRGRRDRVGGEREERCTAGEGGGEIEQQGIEKRDRVGGEREERCTAGEGGGEIEQQGIEEEVQIKRQIDKERLKRREEK